MSDLAEHDATDSNNAPTTAANVRPFDSKFSKSFRRQIRKYVDKVYKVYMKKFKKPRDLNNYERDFFWVVITYIVIVHKAFFRKTVSYFTLYAFTDQPQSRHNHGY